MNASTPAPTTATTTSPSTRRLDYPRLLFSETQRPTQWWLWAIIVVVSGVPAALLLHAARTSPPMRPYLPLVILPATVPVLLLVVMQLRVTVTSTELVLRLFPLRRRIPIDEIAKWEATTYRPLRDFGGWGIKWSLRDSTTSFSVHGNHGVRVVTTKGKKLLIGTQRPAELAAAIASAKAAAPAPPVTPAP